MAATADFRGVATLDPLTGKYCSAARVSLPLLYTNNFDDGEYDKIENGVQIINLNYGGVDTGNAVSGTYSAYFNWVNNTNQFGELRVDLGNQYKKVVVEYDLYTPANMDMVPYDPEVSLVVNQKFARFWTGPASGGDDHTWYNTLTGIEKSGLDWWADSAGIDADLSMSVPILWSGDAAPMNPQTPIFNSSVLDTWRKIKIEAVPPTSTNTMTGAASFKVWVNDVVVLPLTKLYQYSEPDNVNATITGTTFVPGNSEHGFRWFYLLGATNRWFTQSTQFRIDNLKIWGELL